MADDLPDFDAEAHALADQIAMIRAVADSLNEPATIRHAINLRGIAKDIEDRCHLVRFVTEDEAMRITGRSQRWLCARFGNWAKVGAARLRDGERLYRYCVLPQHLPDRLIDPRLLVRTR